jgi:hypothetical protein
VLIGISRKKQLIILSAATAATIACFFYVQIWIIPIPLNPSQLGYDYPYSGYAEFSGIASEAMKSHCFHLNTTVVCDVENILYVSHGVDIQSMTIKLTDAPSSTLSVPTQTATQSEFHITTGAESETTAFATMTIPQSLTGGNGGFGVEITRPPIVNGTVELDMIAQAIVVDPASFGRTYLLQTSFQLTDGFY